MKEFNDYLIEAEEGNIDKYENIDLKKTIRETLDLIDISSKAMDEERYEDVTDYLSKIAAGLAKIESDFNEFVNNEG